MKALGVTIGLLATIFCWIAYPIIVYFDKEAPFKTEVTSYIYLSANAGTLDASVQNLETALKNFKQRGYTVGNTGMWVKTPAHDIAVWLLLRETMLNELKYMVIKRDLGTATPTDISNQLIKLKELLMDGDYVSVPNNVMFYPEQWWYRWWAYWVFGAILPLFAWLLCWALWALSERRY